MTGSPPSKPSRFIMTNRAAFLILFAKLRAEAIFCTSKRMACEPVTCVSRPKRMPSAP